MYKYIGASGALRYTTRRSSYDNFNSQRNMAIDCQNWELRYEDNSNMPIPPDSLADSIARDICKR
jgi:hypothetical protein